MLVGTRPLSLSPSPSPLEHTGPPAGLGEPAPGPSPCVPGPPGRGDKDRRQRGHGAGAEQEGEWWQVAGTPRGDRDTPEPWAGSPISCAGGRRGQEGTPRDTSPGKWLAVPMPSPAFSPGTAPPPPSLGSRVNVKISIVLSLPCTRREGHRGGDAVPAGDSRGGREDAQPRRIHGCAPSGAGDDGGDKQGPGGVSRCVPGSGRTRSQGPAACPSLTPLFALARVTTKPRGAARCRVGAAGAAVGPRGMGTLWARGTWGG